MTAYLNQAAIYSKQKKWDKVIKNCGIVIDKQPTNVKAYFRRGTARMNYGFLEEAKNDLLKAQELDPKNADVVSTLKTLAQKQKEANEKQKKMWGGLFN